MAKYPPETKAQVIAEWQTGESIKALSRKRNLPERTIGFWVKGRTRAPAAPKTQDPFRDLDAAIWQVVSANLRALQAVAEQAQDADWRKGQSAHDLAIFYGVLSDKVVRVLAALERPESSPGPGGVLVES